MGCTSSAPNTITTDSNTADKSIQIEEDTKERISRGVNVAVTEDENRTNETKVLPSCDTFEGTVQLVRNNVSTNSLTVHDRDIPANGHVKESVDEVFNENDNTQDDRIKSSIPMIELLVEKVLETNQHLNETNESHKEPEVLTVDSKDSTVVPENKNDQNETTVSAECNDYNQDTGDINNDVQESEEELEEPSPTQSQSSRATRWEALADIAAELPPSLAVDPLTGQIFAIK